MECDIFYLADYICFQYMYHLPACFSPYNAHVISSLKISHMNTIWTLEKFKLLILSSMFISTQKTGTILGNICLKANFGSLGIKILLLHIELGKEYGIITLIPKP